MLAVQNTSDNIHAKHSQTQSCLKGSRAADTHGKLTPGCREPMWPSAGWQGRCSEAAVAGWAQMTWKSKVHLKIQKGQKPLAAVLCRSTASTRSTLGVHTTAGQHDGRSTQASCLSVSCTIKHPHFLQTFISETSSSSTPYAFSLFPSSSLSPHLTEKRAKGWKVGSQGWRVKVGESKMKGGEVDNISPHDTPLFPYSLSPYLPLSCQCIWLPYCSHPWLSTLHPIVSLLFDSPPVYSPLTI